MDDGAMAIFGAGIRTFIGKDNTPKCYICPTAKQPLATSAVAAVRTRLLPAEHKSFTRASTRAQEQHKSFTRAAQEPAQHGP